MVMRFDVNQLIWTPTQFKSFKEFPVHIPHHTWTLWQRLSEQVLLVIEIN